MPRKETSVRVKRTAMVAPPHRNDWCYHLRVYAPERGWHKVVVLPVAELRDLEARLAAAEAECKWLRKELKAAGIIIKTLRENRV